MQSDLDPKGLEAAEAAWSATDMGLTWKLSDAIRAYLSAVPDEGVVERVKELETELDRITNLYRLVVQRDGMTLATLERERETSRLSQAGVRVSHKFKLGDRVTKTKGSSWTGHVVGFYSTGLTPIGYAVESENEPGSVQIYPEAALSGDTL